MNRTVSQGPSAWLIVDGFGSGRHYAKVLSERGITAFHLQSTAGVPDYLSRSFDASGYEEAFVHQGDEDKLLKNLRSIKNLSVVVPGCEIGVGLADRLSDELGAPSNGRASSALRRNKFDMVDALRKRGVRAAVTYRVASSEQLEDICDAVGIPAVVKPCDSAGSDGVYICKTKSEMFDAFTKIHGARNFLGAINDQVIVQQLLKGRQYIVNSVSHEGKHFIAEIWEDNREDVGSAYLYNYERLVHNRGPFEISLSEYTKTVLDALGVRYGPCHVELMVDEGVPTLIEVGARPAGGIQHEVMVDAQGFSHVSAAVDCYLSHEWQAPKVEGGNAKHVVSVSLISRRGGVLKGYRHIDRIRALASFQCLVGLPEVGARVQVSRSLDTQPGILMLSHADLRQVLADVDAFRVLELDGMFELEGSNDESPTGSQ